MPPISLAHQIACVERELRLRARVYPRLVAQGTMREDLALREQAAMLAVLETLQGLQAQAEPQLSLLGRTVP